MILTSHSKNRPGVLLLLFALAAAAVLPARAQGVSTTTVQGTVYFANGAPGSGTLQLTWPAFTTAAGQAIASGRNTVSIGADGFVSVNLAPNVGANPAGLYYTAVYHLSDGSTSTEYWVVPAAAQATLGQVRAQLMPAAQAVQAVSKSYVDQSIQQLSQSVVTSGGGTLNGPLFLSGDPSSPTQAVTKRYVDDEFAQAVPSGGGVVTGPLTAQRFGAVYQADQSTGADFGAKLQSCLSNLNATYGGTCDARNFTGSLTMASNLTIATPNVTIYLPCATIVTANSLVIPAGTRNVTLHGCASRGTSTASGSQGGTLFQYSGSAPLFQVGDSSYAADTQGFHLDNVAINTTSATSSTAQAIAIWRTQEISLASLYLLGNANQTGITFDGTGNYTGGTVQDVQLTGFQTAINAVGHQIANPATTDWLNATTFVRLHIDCPTTNGNPIGGTIGINLLAGDGNTFTGGDVESCSTAMHLGPNAQNNTIVGLRNENSTSQVVADAGSSYNNWMTGGTMFTGKLTDNGTRNSFLDTFHRSFNGLNGDWYGSQQDATLTNHYRLGIGSGNERGLLNRYQTDTGYRWTTGLSDAAGGQQFYQVLDELNSVYRLSIGQYNQGQSSTNNQTVINSAGTGAVVLNGSANAGTGGVVFGSGGATGSTVATVSNAGNAQFNGSLMVGGTSQSAGTMTVRNNADAEADYYLWPGLTSSQKASYTYKDYNGASQWYMLKDASNNWALNSAVGGVDSFKAYQSNNSGDTYINSSNASGAVRVNYETGSGAAFNIYGGNSSTLYAGFTSPTSIKFPGLAAASAKNCLQIDNSGFITNTGSGCGTIASVAGTGLTFADSSVQTTSQQGALTGAANDATARAAASAAQSSANIAQSTANAALSANGATSTGNGSANLVTFPGALSAATNNGVVNVAAQPGADVCAQMQNAENGATGGATLQSTALGSPSACAGGLTVSNPAVTISHTSPSTITWGGQVLASADSFHVTGMGSPDNGAAPATTWTWAAGFSGIGVQIGNGINHNPQRFKMEGVRLNGNASMPVVLDLRSTFNPYLSEIKVNCGNALGQIGVRFEDSSSGTNGWGITDFLDSTGCDTALDIEVPGGKADASHTFRNADVTANYVGVGVGVYSSAIASADNVFQNYNVSTNLWNAAITAVSRAGNTVTVTTAARSPEIFAALPGHFVSITGVTCPATQVNTISTVVSASRDATGTVTLNLTYPLAVSAGSVISVTSLTGWAPRPPDNTPNGAVLVNTVSIGGTTITYYAPGTAETFTVTNAKAAVVPWSIATVPSNAGVTFSQTATDETCTAGSGSYAGTVGIGFLLNYAQRTLLDGGEVEFAAGGAASEPAGAMTIGVWAMGQAGSLKLQNFSASNNDWPVLDQTATRDTVQDASVSSWGQTLTRVSSLRFGQRNQGLMDAYENNGVSYFRQICVGSVGYEMQGCSWLDQSETPQFAVGHGAAWVPNVLFVGPYSNGAGMFGNATGTYLRGGGSGTENLELLDSAGGKAVGVSTTYVNLAKATVQFGTNSTPASLTATGNNTILQAQGSYAEQGVLTNSSGVRMAGWGSKGFEVDGQFNQGAANTFAGTCTMSNGTSCSPPTLGNAYTSSPVCIATAQGATAIAGACSVSGTTVTITAASTNSLTWGYMLVGNPN